MMINILVLPPTPLQDHQAVTQAPGELPLPPNWNMKTTKEGREFFINHVTKITTWLDPRTGQESPTPGEEKTGAHSTYINRPPFLLRTVFIFAMASTLVGHGHHATLFRG